MTTTPRKRAAREAADLLTGPLRQRLPRGTGTLPRAEVEREQRKRLVRAMAQSVATKGYADTAVADVLREAGISRATFYELFVDKEACFLHGFRKLSEAHLHQLEQAMSADPRAPLPERLHSGLAAWVERMNLDRTLARAFVAEAAAATPASRAAFAQASAGLCARLQSWFDEVRRQHAEVPKASPQTFTLLMHALTGFVVERVREDRPLADDDTRAILRLVLSALGLPGWAGAVDNASTPPTAR